MKQFSRNPFVRMAHTRQIKYMDEQKMIKNKKAEVRQQLISQEMDSEMANYNIDNKDTTS